MANSGCLLLSNSGSMLPHSVPCPPAFLYLQQVSAPGPSAPRAPRTCAPRRRPRPALGRLRAAAGGPAALLTSWRPGWGNCAPEWQRSMGAPGERAVPGRGADWSLGRRSQLFQRRGRGRRAESRGKPKGRTQGFWTPSYFGELCAETRGTREPVARLLPRPRRASPGTAGRWRLGSPAVLQRGPRAGPLGRRATCLVGQRS